MKKMKKNLKAAKNLLDWADELEELDISGDSINNALVVKVLVLDLHKAAGILKNCS